MCSLPNPPAPQLSVFQTNRKKESLGIEENSKIHAKLSMENLYNLTKWIFFKKVNIVDNGFELQLLTNYRVVY